MRDIGNIVVTPAMQVAVDGLVSRLGTFVLASSPAWQPFARSLGLEPGTRDEAGEPDRAGPALVVGSPADLLRHSTTEQDEFGFVVVVGQTARWWQRSPSWADETTLDLWSAGWTPVAIDRTLTTKGDTVVEFVIGNARPTPSVTPADQA